MARLTIAFPLARRSALIRRLAEQMLVRSPSEAEVHFAAQARRQGASLRRKGISETAIQKEVEAFTGAVRRELWRMMMEAPQPGGNRRGTGA
jgi:hypothetical protein